MNSFNTVTFTGRITKVDPQNKTVDVLYTSRSGERKNLNITYGNVSLTWGILHMPMKGDKVFLEHLEGDRVIIRGIYPENVDFLPYLDPGELVSMNENGSYIHWKNRRKKIISTNELVDMDATKGPNGETDFQYELGGITMRARSKQDPTGKLPRWFNHSYLSLFDNGDVVIQSMYRDKPKGLFRMDGKSGHIWIHAGDAKVGEYIELNPLLKEITILSDGNIHQHVQKDYKQTTYGDHLHNVGGSIQIKANVDPSTVDADFDKNKPDTDLNPGDVRLSNKNINHTLSDTLKQASTVLSTGDKHYIDGINRKIGSELSTGEKHIMDGVKGQINSLANQLGLGKNFDDLSADEHPILKTHLDDFEKDMTFKALQNQISYTRTLADVGGITRASSMAMILHLVEGFFQHTALPMGAQSVRIRNI